MTEYTSKPSQFRLPHWAQEFLVRESAATGATKTDVVLEALDDLRRKRFEEALAEGYIAMADGHAAEARAWEPALSDGLEPEEW